MISPESFYEKNLKGKSELEIMVVICSLGREIESLKCDIECSNYATRTWCIDPEEIAQIDMMREYFERAIMAYEEVVGEYIPSAEEQKWIDFNVNIPYIEKLVFSIGGHFGGYKTKTYTVDGDKIHVDVEYSASCNLLALYETNPKEISKEDFFNAFKDLHIGEWYEEYNNNRDGVFVLDGTEWDLEIYFSNGHTPVKIHGSNAYPYNFVHLLELLGMER